MTTLAEDPALAAQGRPAMVVLLTVVFVNLVGFGVLLPILPFYGRSFHAPVWLVTWVFAAFSIGNFFAEPLWGRLSDRVGRRPILLGTIFASGVGFIALAFAPNIWMVLLIRLLSGLTTGNLSTIQGYIADVTPPQLRSGRIGWLGAAFALGFVAGPALGGLLARPELGQAGYRLPLFIAGGLSFASSLGAFLFVRETCAHAQIGAPPGVAFKVLKHALHHPVLGRALVITLLYTAAFAAAKSTFGLWAQHRYGWGPSKLSICLASVAVTAAIAQGFLTGRVTRRYGEALDSRRRSGDYLCNPRSATPWPGHDPHHRAPRPDRVRPGPGPAQYLRPDLPHRPARPPRRHAGPEHVHRRPGAGDRAGGGRRAVLDCRGGHAALRRGSGGGAHGAARLAGRGRGAAAAWSDGDGNGIVPACYG